MQPLIQNSEIFRQRQEAIKARETSEKEKAMLEEQAKQIQNKLDGTNHYCKLPAKVKENCRKHLINLTRKNSLPSKG